MTYAISNHLSRSTGGATATTMSEILIFGTRYSIHPEPVTSTQNSPFIYLLILGFDPSPIHRLLPSQDVPSVKHYYQDPGGDRLFQGANTQDGIPVKKPSFLSGSVIEQEMPKLRILIRHDIGRAWWHEDVEEQGL